MTAEVTGYDPAGWSDLLGCCLTLCLLVCGVTLAVGHGGGLFWLPAAFVISIVVASVNSWVLLVEVLR